MNWELVLNIFFVFGLFMLMVITFVWVVFKAVDKTMIMDLEREEAFESVVEKFDLELDPFGKVALPFKMDSFDLLHTGVDREARNVYRGEYYGTNITVFDFEYSQHRSRELSTVPETFTVVWLSSEDMSAPHMLMLPKRSTFRSHKPYRWTNINTKSFAFFNAVYQLRAYNVDQLNKNLTPDFFDAFKSRTDFALETHRSQMIMMHLESKKVYLKEELMEMVDHALTLHEMFVTDSPAESDVEETLAG